MGGTGQDAGNGTGGIAVDTSGNAYVTAETTSVNFPTTAGAFQPALAGGVDTFVTKFNAAGSALLYSTYLGGSGADIGGAIAVDSLGNAYITGETNSADFPTSSPIQATYGGGIGDAFVTKLNASGSALVYSTYLGGNGTFDSEFGSGIAVDVNGNAYVTGQTASTNFPTTPGAFQATLGGATDGFVAKISSTTAAPTLTTITVTPANPTVAEGGTRQFTATGTYTDSSTLDLTNSVSWGSGTLSVATITAGGLATGVGAGTSFITATSGVISGSTTLTVLGPPTIAKAFGSNAILLGGNTTLTFTIANPNTTTTLTGVGFTDLLPAGLIVATPNGLTPGSCGGTVSAVAGSSIVTLTNGIFPPNTNCVFSLTVIGQQIGALTNVTGRVTSTEGGTGGTATASITVQSQQPNCFGQQVTALAKLYGGLKNAAAALGFASVAALEDSIHAACGQ